MDASSPHLLAAETRLTELTADYANRQRAERPHSQLAQVRKQVQTRQCRCARQAEVVTKAAQQVERQICALGVLQAHEAALRQRLARCEHENATNGAPVQAAFRLDAGFGTWDNVALLIEMGYEVYTRPHNHRVRDSLLRRTTAATCWTRVGDNVEMVAWPAERLNDCPYPADFALERFYTGKTLRYGVLLHFGTDAVTTDLPAWFIFYNGRQTVEAGIKEGKGVFQMHHLKVRTAPALWLQEQLAAFAANFVRWAAQWLTTQCYFSKVAIMSRFLRIRL